MGLEGTLVEGGDNSLAKKKEALRRGGGKRCCWRLRGVLSKKGSILWGPCGEGCEEKSGLRGGKKSSRMGLQLGKRVTVGKSL